MTEVVHFVHSLKSTCERWGMTEVVHFVHSFLFGQLKATCERWGMTEVVHFVITTWHVCRIITNLASDGG